MSAGPRLPVEVAYEAPRDPERGDYDFRWHVEHDTDGRLGEITWTPGMNTLYVWQDGHKILTSIEIEEAGRSVALVQAVAFLLARHEDITGRDGPGWWRTPVARIGGES